MTMNSPTTALGTRRQRSMKKKSGRSRLLLRLTLLIILCILAGNLWFFLTPSGSAYRYMLADSLITTEHRYLAKYLLGAAEYKNRVARYQRLFDQMGDVPDQHEVNVSGKNGDQVYTIEPISEAKFKGYLVIVPNPKDIRVVVPGKFGHGEKISSMAARTGALAGVNAGGFVDPNLKGNGFQPIGLVMSDGKLFYHDSGMNVKEDVVGIDKDGVLVAGRYTPQALLDMGVQEAVTFQPRFIVNGKGMIKSEADGWGIAPRTCIAQTKDGTILIAVIDGRQAHSIGATLYDVQQIFLAHGAITAANLDGGSSTELYADGRVVNSPSSAQGEVYLPNALLIFQHPEQVEVKNIWEGVDMTHFDAATW